MSFLESMVEQSRARVLAAREEEPEEDLRARAGASRSGPPYHAGPFEVWAELKPRSPSAGTLHGNRDLETEPSAFGGSLELLSSIAAAVELPVMRKDFLTDPYQVWQARAAGASGILLMANILPGAALAQMLETAAAADLFVLLEAFNQEELDRGAAALDEVPVGVLGVNCRDLTSLAVDPGRFAQMALPHHPVIAESGVETTDQVAALAGLGYRGVLVGTTLMQSADPQTTIASMVAAGEAACPSA